MQTRKVHAGDLAAARPVLEADGWTYAGPLKGTPDVHRFTREGDKAPAGDTVVAPQDTYIKVRGWMNG